MTTNHTYQHTVLELMAMRNIPSINHLAKRAGVAFSTAKRAAIGDGFANNESAAEAIALALSVRPSDIRWPKTPSTLGKPIGNGKVAKQTTKVKICPVCRLEVPSGTGVCDVHGLIGL